MYSLAMTAVVRPDGGTMCGREGTDVIGHTHPTAIQHDAKPEGHRRGFSECRNLPLNRTILRFGKCRMSFGK